MDNFFESFFWVIIILIWVSSLFSKAKKATQSKEGSGFLKLLRSQSDESSGPGQEIYQTFGFPFGVKQYTAPKPKVRILPKPQKKEVQLELKDALRQKKAPEFAAAAKPVKKETPALIFSTDKLQEGIIMAEILGPPKAYQFCRGVGIGIRSGLKNRWA